MLAGGLSKRFAQDKARYIFQGQPLMAWVLSGLTGATERFIIANRPYAEFGLPVYSDLHPGGDTMSGLHSALAHAQQDWVAIAGCDQPFLSADYWLFLLQQAQPGLEAVVACGQGFIEPLGGLYSKTLEPLVLEHLRSGNLRMQGLLEEANILGLPMDDLHQRFGPDLFLNANTPGELQPPR